MIILTNRSSFSGVMAYIFVIRIEFYCNKDSFVDLLTYLLNFKIMNKNFLLTTVAVGSFILCSFRPNSTTIDIQSNGQDCSLCSEELASVSLGTADYRCDLFSDDFYRCERTIIVEQFANKDMILDQSKFEHLIEEIASL